MRCFWSCYHTSCAWRNNFGNEIYRKMGEKRYLHYITIMSAISRDQCYFHFKLSMSAAAIDWNDCYPDKDRYVNECRVLKLKLFLTARGCAVTCPFYQNAFKPPFKYYWGTLWYFGHTKSIFCHQKILQIPAYQVSNVLISENDFWYRKFRRAFLKDKTIHIFKT